MRQLTQAQKNALATRTAVHFTPDYLASWRHICDPLADTAVSDLFTTERGVIPSGHTDLLTACRAAAAQGSAACQQFLIVNEQIPDWVDFEAFTAGQNLFRGNGVLTFLIGVSVLVASYGGYKDNKVLAMSGRLGAETSFRRAVETAQFTMDVTAPDGLRPGNPGWTAVLQVRLLHARVRQLCHQYGYDIAAYDQPINQEAMCGAIMLFSHGVIRALNILGVHVTDAEKESYHALWRYAGWLMGVDLALLPERHIEEAVLFECHQYNYVPDSDTDLLYEGTVDGITQGAGQLPRWLSLMGGGLLQNRPFVENFIGYTVNDTLRTYLHLTPTPGWRLLFGMLRGLLGGLSRIQWAFPPLKRGMVWLQGTLMERIVQTLIAGNQANFNDAGALTSPVA